MEDPCQKYGKSQCSGSCVWNRFSIMNYYSFLLVK
jgi:hypothetical protein